MAKHQVLDKCEACITLKKKFDALAVELDVLMNAVHMSAKELVKLQQPNLIGEERTNLVKAVMVSLLQDAKDELNKRLKGEEDGRILRN